MPKAWLHVPRSRHRRCYAASFDADRVLVAFLPFCYGQWTDRPAEARGYVSTTALVVIVAGCCRVYSSDGGVSASDIRYSSTAVSSRGDATPNVNDSDCSQPTKAGWSILARAAADGGASNY